ncbi:35081_t:CDS:2, partial [Racocetra persica]
LAISCSIGKFHPLQSIVPLFHLILNLSGLFRFLIAAQLRKMQAITFQQPFKVLVKTVPFPKIIQDTDVIVKISVGGLCGSDLHIYRGNEVGIEKDTIM